MEVFEVWVLEARYLSTKHKSGKSDAYCRLRTNFNTQQYKSHCATKSPQPQWGACFKFFPADDPPTGNITIKFYERKSILPDHNIGQIVLDISAYIGGNEQNVWIVLQDEPKKKLNIRGEVHMKMRYIHDDPLVIANGKHISPRETRQKSKTLSAPTTPTPVPREREPHSVSAAVLKSSDASTYASVLFHSQDTANCSSSSILTLEDKYELGKELGKGAFSSVYRAKNKLTDEEVAIKVVNKRDVKKRDLELLEREIKILKKLKHPHIVRLYDLFEGQDCMYIVLELVPEGELFDQLVKNGAYTESDARSLIRQVLEGVDYMHKNGVVHRDLKPENLLCQDATHIKIADFGMSKDISSMGMLKTAVGTPSYIAPEIIQGINTTSYDSGCDMWSIGVLCYVLLCGYAPFWGETQDQLFTRITKGIFEFPSPEWDEISQHAKEFVQALLTPNPADRPSAEVALCHEWIKNKYTSKLKLTLATKNLAIMHSQRLSKDSSSSNVSNLSIVSSVST